jgi:hypothetical protein
VSTKRIRLVDSWPGQPIGAREAGMLRPDPSDQFVLLALKASEIEVVASQLLHESAHEGGQ